MRPPPEACSPFLSPQDFPPSLSFRPSSPPKIRFYPRGFFSPPPLLSLHFNLKISFPPPLDPHIWPVSPPPCVACGAFLTMFSSCFFETFLHPIKLLSLGSSTLTSLPLIAKTFLAPPYGFPSILCPPQLFHGFSHSLMSPNYFRRDFSGPLSSFPVLTFAFPFVPLRLDFFLASLSEKKLGLFLFLKFPPFFCFPS